MSEQEQSIFVDWNKLKENLIVTEDPEEEDDLEDNEEEGEQKGKDYDNDDATLNVASTSNDTLSYLKYSGEVELSEECSCLTPISLTNALGIMNSVVNSKVDKNIINCLIDNLIRSINYIFTNDDKIISEFKIAATDLFYRARHELLFKLLCHAYNLPMVASDIPFSNFGIDSNKTPDLIIDVEGCLVIIEVTAISSYERAAINKGVEHLGFESKYKNEIDQLTERGINNKYLPVFFNMREPSAPFYSEQIAELDLIFKKSLTNFLLLKSVARSLAIISSEIREQILLYSTLLFSNNKPIKRQHPNHQFLYSLSEKTNINYKYNEITISPKIYNKIVNNWHRLSSLIDRRGLTDQTKIIIVVNTNDHRISIEKNDLGSTVSTVLEFINKNDKQSLFKCVKIRAGSILIDCTDSNTGVKFYEKSGLTESKKFDQIKTFMEHKPYHSVGLNFEMSYYSKFISDSDTLVLNSNFYDPDYEDKLIESIIKNDSLVDYSNWSPSSAEFLGSMKTTSIDIDQVFENIYYDYLQKNSSDDKLPLTKLKMKSPFILPLASLSSNSYCKLDVKNVEFIHEVSEILKGDNPYTSLVLQGVLKDNYKMFTVPKLQSSTIRDMYNQRYRVSNDINKLQKDYYKSPESKLECRISKTSSPFFMNEFNRLRSEFNNINKEIKGREKFEKLGKDISFIRLPTKNVKSELRNLFDREMIHFKDTNVQSTIEGVGVRSEVMKDFKNDINVFNNICLELVEYRGFNPEILLDDFVDDDCRLLKDLKNIALDEYRAIINQVKNSCLGHASTLVSRLGHTLMFLSQLSYNSDYVRVDNLGYNNVLLIVRGGKKIFKSKSSKLFRLIYPVLDSSIPWYKNGHNDKGSIKLINILGVNYICTPWTLMHESVLTDSISFYPRLCSFTILNSNPNLSLTEQFHKMSVNILLSFHNRRQTEVLLANLRYILLSTLGDFTGVDKILPEFFGFNYDCFQAFIRGCILVNYPQYFKSVETLKLSKSADKSITINEFQKARVPNIFTLNDVTNIQDLTLMIYSTFLMTKAPYQRAVERANNLKGILQIHELYKKTVGVNLTPEQQLSCISVSVNNDDFEGYVNKLFSNDFNIDPYYCTNVGIFIDSILISKGLKEEINNLWYKIINSTWDELATSTGLRGSYPEVEDFWGQKGYFVVYKKLLNDPDFVEGLNKIFYLNESDDKKRKLLRSYNQIYMEKMEDEREFLIFHAVDKVQWRGSREIYVMDLTTKTLQQPIEKFLGELCKYLDNELISIPSDRRSQVIHHSIFEKDLPLKDVLTWYLTLDCSKWAPKSVFVKFAITFLGMTVLPTSFKIHFLNYIEKLFYKRVYFNTSEVEVLSKNEAYKKMIADNLIYDETVKGFYILMPYSWVMGIFNYTSSFLHAANQSYASYLLMKTSIISFNEECSLNMFAHSDDSGGRLTVPNMDLAQRSLILYEINLKCCNHLLSKKKSVVSRIYFEILSIIYMFKQLLALLPKFLGGLRFLPTDKGPCQDMSQSYSKCIEVLVAGANFNISYIVLKIYSMMVWRFYNSGPPTILDYRRPVQYLGIPDSHPLMCLLCGSDSDIIRLLRNEDSLGKLIGFVSNLMNTTEDVGPIKPIKFEIKVKGVKRGFEDFIEMFSEQLNSWSIRNVNYHSTIFNTLSFLRKLNDSGFVGSLVNESTTRRVSRAYFLRSGKSLMTNFGNIKLAQSIDSLRLFQDFQSKGSAVEMIFNEVLEDDQINLINQSIKDSMPEVEISLKVLKAALQSPLKICSYMDRLSMDNRAANYTPRTLKPTVVQLVKTTGLFSHRFDPATLVSYIKEPEFNWAINDSRSLITSSQEIKTYLSQKGFEINKMSPDNLLRLCRDFSVNSTKNIYLYSRVPTELRQIKSYMAFLTFLSVNTYDDRSIAGLTLKLSPRNTEKEYTQSNVNDEVMLVNNIISVLNILCQKCDVEFVKSISLNKVDSLEWGGGNVLDFIRKVKNDSITDVNLQHVLNQCNFVEDLLVGSVTNAEILNNGSYYTFLKKQRVRGSWYGKGEVYIRVGSNFYSFILFNSDITQVYTNEKGKILQHHAEYIKDVFDHIGIDFNSIHKSKVSNNYKGDLFGLDYSRQLAILPSREIISGIPCTLKSFWNEYVEHLGTYNIINMFKDHFLIRCDIFDKPTIKKINFLPLKQNEIMGVIPIILKKSEFESKFLEMGLNDFEEFILTEVLTEYGSDNYVDFNALVDNYQASKLFTIFKKCREDSLSVIPKKQNITLFPASEGSLTKILIDYTLKTGDNVLYPTTNLNPTLMQVRSEFPDQLSVILSENLIQYFDKMFTKEEIKEITDSYMAIAISEDEDLTRKEIIKLMTYWGYGSFVNALQGFTLLRKRDNFIYFNYGLINNSASANYSSLFIKLVNSLNDCMMMWSNQYNSLDLIEPLFKNKCGLEDVICKYLIEICLECYNGKSIDYRLNINVLQYHDLLYTLLKEEDFCAQLQYELNKDYILGSLPIDFSCRKDILILLNNLRLVWQKQNTIHYSLNFTEKLERLPYQIINPKSMTKQFTHGNLISPSLVYHHGAISEETLIKIRKKDSIELKTNSKTYRITSKLSNLSKTEVIMNEFVLFNRPLKESVLQSDEFDELKSELECEEPYKESIDELLDEIGQLYKPKVTKSYKVNNSTIIRATINWVICTSNSCKVTGIDQLRQIGENVVYLSNSPLKNCKKIIYNCRERLIEYKRGEILYVMLSFQDELNDLDFINKYIGGSQFDESNLQIEDLCIGVIRDSDGIPKKSINIGNFIDNAILSESKVLVDEDGVSKYKAIEDIAESSTGPVGNETQKVTTNDKSDRLKRILDKIDELKFNNTISPESIKNLRDKYVMLATDYFTNTQLLMESLLKESEFFSFNSLLDNNKIELTPQDYKNTFLSPPCFGMAYSLNQTDPKSIKDKKVKAEIESLHEKLAAKIGSGTLNLSKGFKRVVDSQLILWKSLIKSTRVRRENKQFLYTWILSIINSSNVNNSTDDDDIWQSLVNLSSIYMTIGEDLDDESDDDYSYMFDIISNSRITYKPKGT